MTPPIWLIAEREFRAYVATVSFWVALAVGPLAMAAALGLTVLAAPSAPARVGVIGPDLATERAAIAVLSHAARLEGRALQAEPGPRPQAEVIVTPAASGVLSLRFVGPVPLSPLGRELVTRTLERDALARRLGVPMPSPLATPPLAAPDGRAAARFGLVLMLWLTLTGSLGMLLQAVVRERANRALEGLLAAASPLDIVLGKLLGVGAVSLVILGAWLGAAGALAPFAPKQAGLASAVLANLGDPLSLLRAALLYLAAYAFYGLLTIAVGASARDTAQAQNLSRPMFAMLLAAFFAAMASAAAAGPWLTWLAVLPPFAPFVLLAEPPGALGVGVEVVALLGLTIGSVLCARSAMRALELGPHKPGRRAILGVAPQTQP